MNLASSRLSPGAAWCLRFLEERCRACVSAVPGDEGKSDEAEATSSASVLSLAEADLSGGAPDASAQEHLAVVALRMRSESGERVALRFITPAAMRSAGRIHGARWLINDIAIPTPPDLDEVSVIVYRIRRTARLERVLAIAGSTIDILEATGDDEELTLGRAVLENLEVLDDADDAEILLGASGLRFAETGTPGAPRYLAVVAPVGGAPPNPLWLIGRELHEGPDRASAALVIGRSYVLFRLGSPSTRESVRQFIDEIRRRHQRRAGQPVAGAEGESFAAFVGRQVDERRQELIETMFGHHAMLPVVTPVALEVAKDLAETVAYRDDPPSRFTQLVNAMRGDIEQTFGVGVPRIRVRINETAIPKGMYILMLDETPLVSGTTHSNELFCLANRDLLAEAGLEGLEEVTAPDASDRAGCWIAPEQLPAISGRGFETLDAAAYIAAHLRSLLLANLSMFANLDDIVPRLGGYELLTRLRQSPGGLPRFAEVLQSLLMEEVPITPLQPIAEAYLARAGELTGDVAEEMRALPAPHFSITRGCSGWRLFALADDFEAKLSENIVRDGDAALLALTPELTQEMLTSVRNHVGSLGGAIAVSDWKLRPFVRSLVMLEFPRVRVVARREIEGLAGLPAPAGVITLEP